MAGIYLHIPFCKTRCIYCDFYSTTHGEWADRYIRALCRELRERRDYLKGEPVRTLYLGGGTPSQLSEEHFVCLFDTLQEVYGLEQCEEITLEANPDDLTQEYAAMLQRLPFNRVSMGIQTFHDPTLQLLKRRHSARQAVEAIGHLRQAGFANLSIDLIYGLPGETDNRWQEDLEQAMALQVEHISAYHLTYEEDTPLHRLLQERQVKEVDEESSLRFFSLLMERLDKAGYEHYEISNFCKPGMHSRHNSAYWLGVPYLGCGPSAHSFDRASREWNIASLSRYMEGMEQGRRCFEVERLDLTTRYNEYVMTALRTRQGLSVSCLQTLFGSALADYCLRMARPHLEQGRLQLHEGRLSLTRQGIFTSDGIICDLMSVEEEGAS